MEEILTSLIAGGLSLVGVIISNNRSTSKIQSDMRAELTKAQAVTDTKLEALTREVREHNNFARRVPVLEAAVQRNTQDIADLSEYHKEHK